MPSSARGTEIKKVLVLWADKRSPNLGVRVLAEGAAELAKSVWPEASITLQDFAPNEYGFALGRQSMLRQVRSRFITEWIDQFDIILDTGAGDSFTDSYGLKRLVMMTVTQRAAAESSAKFVMLPQTIGPFSTPLGRRLAKQTMKRVDQVYVRDSTSLATSHQLTLNSKLATDLVFMLPTFDKHDTHDILVNVSGLIWAGKTQISAKEYRTHIIELIEALLMKGRSVSLLAHVLDNPSKDNDCLALESLSAVFPDVPLIVPRDLYDARKTISGARLVIGSRMHACLNALSQGVPAIPWAYSRKFAPLLEDLGWNYVVDAVRDNDPVSSTLLLLDKADLESNAERTRHLGNKAMNDLFDSLGEL